MFLAELVFGSQATTITYIKLAGRKDISFLPDTDVPLSPSIEGEDALPVRNLFTRPRQARYPEPVRSWLC